MKRKILLFLTLLVLPAGPSLAQGADYPDLSKASSLTPEEVLARFDHEPSVRDVQKASIEYYMVQPERIRSLRAGSRLKALMPTIEGKFVNQIADVDYIQQHGLYRSEEWTPFPSGPPYFIKDGTNLNNYSWGVAVSWDLRPLVFNAEELDVASLIGILDSVVREVTTTYYIRRRLQIQMLLQPPRTLADKISSKIRIDELTGILDALTGGYMSRKVKEAEERLKTPGR